MIRYSTTKRIRARPDMTLNSGMVLHFARQRMASHQIYEDGIFLLIAGSKFSRKIFHSL